MTVFTPSKAMLFSINGGYSVLVRGRSRFRLSPAAPLSPFVYGHKLRRGAILGTCAFVPMAYSKATSI